MLMLILLKIKQWFLFLLFSLFPPFLFSSFSQAEQLIREEILRGTVSKKSTEEMFGELEFPSEVHFAFLFFNFLCNISP
jgi:hypothetical protein